MKKRLKKNTVSVTKRKIKASRQREAHEAEMTQYLLDKGWTNTGPLGNVWKHDLWKSHKDNPESRHGYVQEKSGLIRKVWSTQPIEKARTNTEVFLTLHQAYKAQLKLDSMGYEKPKSIDDDLADLL